MESAHRNHFEYAISQYLLDHSLTISIAESATEGYIQSVFATMPYAESFYNGGITLDNLGENTRKKNIISEGMAIKMAKQITGLFSSSVGISIAGYNVSDTNARLHYAYCALVVDDKIISTKRIKSRMTGTSNIHKSYTEQMLKWILLALRKGK